MHQMTRRAMLRDGLSGSLASVLFGVTALRAQAQAPGPNISNARPSGAALRAALDFRAQNPAFSAMHSCYALVDFTQPSRADRFFILSANDSAILLATRTAHGKGSDLDADGMAQIFSNDVNSLCSSVGAYQAGSEYQGKHGRSLRLRGLTRSASNAETRAIVLHSTQKNASAHYVSDAYLQNAGLGRRIGRSDGCFVVDVPVLDAVIEQLKDGALLYAWGGPAWRDDRLA